MRVAAAAFVAAAIFLAGVMVGLGSGDVGDPEVPVAIALVDEGTTATPRAQEKSNVKEVQHPAKRGEVDDNSGPGGDKAEYWDEEAYEDNSGPGGGDDSESDSSGPGSGGDDSSGPGSGSDDNSGSGSGSSGSGSDGSGDSSGPG